MNINLAWANPLTKSKKMHFLLIGFFAKDGGQQFLIVKGNWTVIESRMMGKMCSNVYLWRTAIFLFVSPTSCTYVRKVGSNSSERKTGEVGKNWGHIYYAVPGFLFIIVVVS